MHISFLCSKEHLSTTDVKHQQIHKPLTSAELTSGLESTEAESGLYSALEPERT